MMIPITPPIDKNIIEWRISEGMTPYIDAITEMEARVDAILAGTAPEQIWLLEHPPLYTAGTSAKTADLLSQNFPVFHTGRGGQFTYHGPGQRVAYCMLDLKKRFAPDPPDLRVYVQTLEQWIINVLAELGIQAFVRKGRIGVWVKTGNSEAKIAAIGIRVRKWVAYHGICININPDLNHYNGIIPCGIREFGVTSLEKLGLAIDTQKINNILREKFPLC